MNKHHYEKAIDAIDGIIQIAKNDQLKGGQYVSPHADEKLAKKGAICKGHKACLLGSLAIGYGFKFEELLDGVGAPSDFFDDSARPLALRGRPALRLAYEALNAAADKRLPENLRGPAVYEKFQDTYFGTYYTQEKPGDRKWASQAEHYFEVTLQGISRKRRTEQVISLCREAKSALRRQMKKEHGG